MVNCALRSLSLSSATSEFNETIRTRTNGHPLSTLPNGRWKQMLSHDSTCLQPTPFSRSVSLHKDRDESFKTSMVRPSPSLLTSPRDLSTLIPDYLYVYAFLAASTITASATPSFNAYPTSVSVPSSTLVPRQIMIAENVRIIRDELRLLSEYVRNGLMTTERIVVTPAAAPTVVHRDRSVGGRSDISEPRITPAGPRDRPHLIPVEMSPPLTRTPSITSSASGLSYLSSHHSDVIFYMGNMKPWKGKNTSSRRRLLGRHRLCHHRPPISRHL